MGFQKSISYKNPRHGAPGPIGTSKSKMTVTVTRKSVHLLRVSGTILLDVDNLDRFDIRWTALQQISRMQLLRISTFS